MTSYDHDNILPTVETLYYLIILSWLHCNHSIMQVPIHLTCMLTWCMRRQCHHHANIHTLFLEANKQTKKKAKEHDNTEHKYQREVLWWGGLTSETRDLAMYVIMLLVGVFFYFNPNFLPVWNTQCPMMWLVIFHNKSSTAVCLLLWSIHMKSWVIVTLSSGG